MVTLARKTPAGDDLQAAALSVAAAAETLAEEDGMDVLPEDNENRPQMWSTGCTTLNMALTDNPDEGWPLGRFINMIGDSSSGKTFLALTALAEAAHDPRLNHYDLYFDDVEEANTFDIPKLFGKKTAARVKPPRMVDGVPVNSSTVEGWYGTVMGLIAKGIPFIYVTDSIDAMSDAEEMARAAEYVKLSDGSGKKAKKKKTLDGDDAEDDAPAVAEVKGSYKTGKAKMLSEGLRNLVGGLARTNSTVIAISQVRDNMDPRSARFTPKIRAGGRALKFYATYEMWLSHKMNIMHAGAKRKIGDQCKVKVTKNKVTGKQREAEFPLYYSYGIDDIASCLAFLLEAGAISISGAIINAENVIGKSGTKNALATYLEDTPEAMTTLRKAVADEWLAIEEKIKMNRRRKYE